MDRKEMIFKLIADCLSDWVFASNYDGLVFYLKNGFKGFENYTDQELIDACAEILDENIDFPLKIKQEIKEAIEIS